MESSTTPQHEPAGYRPAPGPAGIRPIWDGERAMHPPVYSLPPEPTTSRWSKDRAFGPSRSSKRVTGLDAARGFALLGMVAIHLLPSYNEYTGRPTFVWETFAGHAAALFAVLAGITIALSTGSNEPYSGDRMRRARYSLAVRSVIILLLGLAIDELNIPVYNILPYYGLMFFVAIPLTALRIRVLLAFTSVFFLLGPFVMFLTSARVDYTTISNPNYTALVSLPVDSVITLFVGGAYPIATWMGFICLGMAVGRLNLHWLLTHIRLLIAGAVFLFAGSFLSTILIDFLGGFANLYYYTDGYDAEDIMEVIDFGPNGHLPTDTLWWLAINGPHTNTTFALLNSAGWALFSIAAFLVISRLMDYLLTPLIAAGSMSLTLYVAHLVTFAGFGDSIEQTPITWFFAQLAVAVLFASGWQLTIGKGPLEAVVSGVCRRASYVVVPAPPAQVTVDVHDKQGNPVQ